jgi:hypothetical protein
VGSAGGAPASRPAPGAGIVKIAPHSGHFAFLPAVSSRVRNNRLHSVQRNSIGMVLDVPRHDGLR